MTIPLKIVLVGQGSVGKTSILTRYITGNFSDGIIPTIGANFLSKEVEMKGTVYELNIWDTAGQELYRSLAPMYYRNAQVAIVVFDVTSQSSFNEVQRWIDQIRQNDPQPYLILCGNKTDLEDHRQIRSDQAENIAESNKIKYIETSAVTGQGIEQLFQLIPSYYSKTSKTPNSSVAELQKSDDKSSCC